MFRERQETPKGGFIVADRCVLLQVTFPDLDVSLQQSRSVRARRGLKKSRKQSEKCLPLRDAQTKFDSLVEQRRPEEWQTLIDPN
jgi:hypothetical protein